jgi:hypothetical protein
MDELTQRGLRPHALKLCERLVVLESLSYRSRTFTTNAILGQSVRCGDRADEHAAPGGSPEHRKELT